MHGGTIAANKATIYTGKGNGGGVSVVDGGRFTMNGGTIGGTSATRDYNQATGNGGGVYVKRREKHLHHERQRQRRL